MRHLVLLLALSACVADATVFIGEDGLSDPDPDPDPDTEPAEVDADGDGWSVDEDCDDDDPEVNPGMDERCDRVDHDCDGRAFTEDTCPCPVVLSDDQDIFLNACEERLPWVEARDLCDEYGLHLVVVEDEAESKLVADLIANMNAATAWIGLSDREREGEFRWVDGTRLTWDAFAWGEPNDFGRGEDCVGVFSWNAQWNDMDCRDPQPFVCELD